ncbi:MAG: cadherin repeat domain-containing protein [Chloroflexi bacterium]|nr:cadherin repeat domain-containing protein [Chloroflexota bacterium]
MSNKKIWSVPIAVLALALMLVGGMFASSVVRAQSSSGATYHMLTTATGALAPAIMINGLDRSDFANGRLAAISTSTAAGAEGAALSGTGSASFTTTLGGVPAGTTSDESQSVTITPASGDNAPDAGVYNLTLTVRIDVDTGTDGPDTGGTPTDDNDRVITAPVTIYVVGVTPNIQFHADPSTALAGQRASTFGMDVRNSPQAIKVSGLGPKSKIVVDGTVTGANAGSGVLSSQNGLTFTVDPSDRSSIVAHFSGAALGDDSTSTFTVDIDTDVTKDTPDNDDSLDTDPWRGDGVPDNDVDLDGLSVTAALDTVTSLGWGDSEGATADAADMGPTFAFTMLSSEPSGSAIGNILVDGAHLDTDEDGTDATAAAPAGGEFLDGILLDANGNAQSMFSVTGTRATQVDNQPMQVVFNGGEIALGTHSYRLSVNGDSGIAHRTISDGGDGSDPLVNVMITVNPVNEGPMGPDSHAVTVQETQKGAGILGEGDKVVDISGLATDTNVLMYTLSGEDSALFDVDSSGMVMVGSAGIVDNAVTKEAVVDNPVTTTVDETAPAEYGRSDGGDIADKSNLYSDVTYKFTVNVSDGNASSSHNIAVTVTVDVNEPVMEMGDIGGEMLKYKTTDVQNHEIVNLNDYLSSSDSEADGIKYVWMVTPANPPFGIYDGSIRITYPGHAQARSDDPNTPNVDESWDPYMDGWDIRVLVGDAFANGMGPKACENDDGDAVVCMDSMLGNGVDAVLDFNIMLVEGPPLESRNLQLNVPENSPAGTVVGMVDVSIGGVDATSYTLLSGTHGARDDFALDGSTGEITVVNPRDYDAEGAENNLVLLVDAFGPNGNRMAAVIVGIEIQDIDEAPMIEDLIVGASLMESEIPWVSESAQLGAPVLTKPVGAAGGALSDPPTVITATDPEMRALTYSISGDSKAPFAIDAMTGALTVSGMLDAETAGSHTFMVKVEDPAGNYDTTEITVHVTNSNEKPVFTSPLGDAAVTVIPENTGSDVVIFTFTATDPDGDDLTFTLREGQSRDLFEIKNQTNMMVDGVEVWSGNLHAKAGALDFEDQDYDSRVHLVAQDPQGLDGELLLTVNLENLNDEAPTWDAAPKTELNLAENTSRGAMLANYSATDPDNLAGGIEYSLTGANAKSFEIMYNGDLLTLESIDHDSATPCAGNVCNITVNANDGAQTLTADVRISIIDAEDSISTLDIRKANPVPGPNAGLPDSALSGAKTTRMASVAERPADLPATEDTYDLDNDGVADNITDAVNFVETEWANWGTVLLIEITSESPDSDCGNGNQCVVVDLESDSADDKLSVIAYRSAHDENKFLAAVKLVGRSASAGDGTSDPAYLMPTDHNAPGGIRPRDMGATPGDAPVYKHTDGTVARLQVDEEDEISIGYDNLRDSVDVENDPPEIESFAPAHESAFDNADVDYTFRITDGLSGIPGPEDLPDGDGDEDYIPVIAVVSGMQCARPEVSVGKSRTIRADSAQCNDKRGIHEYDATTASRSDWGYIAVREDKDFDDIDNGYEVETTLVLDEDKIFYVTFVVVDRAGNMAYFDPDGSDDDVEYAEIVIDVDEPDLYEARAGVTWDEGDEEYDDDRSVIQVIFNDLTQLNPATVEIDDFVVEGHTIVAAHVYEQPDDWTDTSRYASGGELRYRNADGLRLRQSIETSVFLHLEDELQADETPDVTLVPNGIEDVAGNEQDDGEAEADDWISPAFTIVSIVSPRETTENPDVVLAGDGDEVVFNVTVDERLSTARPTVTVSYVDAASVDTKGTATCDNGDGDSDMHDGKRKRGEITMNTSGETSALCANNDLVTDHNLKTTVEKVTNTEWIVTVGEPKGTGYYNFHIAGKDRSAQQNPGSEGVDPDSVVTDFYDSDGDVNMDDAVYYQGDINLPKPNVRLGGVDITDNEPSVEYRSRLFLEIDFTRRYEDRVACEDLPSLSDNYRLANCMNENSEYAEDSFDDVVVTSFVLDGVDITDSVRTTDDQTFLVTLENIGLGDHEVEIQAMDQAGNELEDTLEIDFEVSDRDPFEKRLSPGWNLISLPGEPADSSIASVIGPGVEVRTVYTYNPIVPGGWQVAVRETLDSEWQGDLTEITGQRGYWILSDAIQDWEVNIPRLAGGAVGTGTPIQPPVIPLYAGWNLIPVTDVKGNALDHNTPIDAAVYLQSLEDGIEAARVLGFDTIRNEWYTVLDGDMMSPGMGTNLLIGSGYWVFVRNATALVPGGVAGSGGSSD